MGTPSLLVVVDYLDLLAEVEPEKLSLRPSGGMAGSRSRRPRS
jgi:hypothetical protein